MPRHARLDAPGALHHVMVRGINKGQIFLDDQDRRKFLAGLSEAVLAGEALVYAFAVMDKHAHILIELSAAEAAGASASPHPPSPGPSKGMRIGQRVTMQRLQQRPWGRFHVDIKSLPPQGQIGAPPSLSQPSGDGS